MLKYLRIAVTVLSLTACVLLIVWSVDDFHKVGVVAFIPYVPPILWCLALAAVPWATEIAWFSCLALRKAAIAAKRNYGRVALSTPCMAATALIVWMWFHSYYWSDTTQGVIGSQRLQFRSVDGVLSLLVYPERDSRNFPDRSWTHQRHESVGERPAPWAFRKMTPRGTEVAAPHWITAAILAFVAALPWLWLVRLPIRFSLRTLLIATTLVAVVLGIVVAAR